ncbi:MAG TPA: hypothetical protein PK256_00970, partial [Verrucomicrobiota bacterium]|nr:hypothetical protein [Verrucomicrobiota bacterium]
MFPSRVLEISISRLLLVALVFPRVLVAGSLGEVEVRNGEVEDGEQAPRDWTSGAGRTEWSSEAHWGKRSLAVFGKGDDAGYWQSAPLRLEPGRLYVLSFWARQSEGTTGGCATAGVSPVNRDYNLTSDWRCYRYVFQTPQDVREASLRLGQWHLNGSVFFDDIELAPVTALHARLDNDLELGEGESLEAGRYRCRIDFEGEGSNSHRTLRTNQAGFNSNRWLFHPGALLAYQHTVPGSKLNEGRVRVALNYQEGGELRVEASADGRNWELIGQVDKPTSVRWFVLPARLFPSEYVMIRLRHAGDSGHFQVNTYEFEAGISDTTLIGEGWTRYLSVKKSHPEWTVKIRGFHVEDAFAQGKIDLSVSHRGRSVRRATLTVHDELQDNPGAEKGNWRWQDSLLLKEGESLEVSVPWKTVGPGNHRLCLRLSGSKDDTYFAGQMMLRGSFLQDHEYGYRLSDAGGLKLWWCESGWKVGRHQSAPVHRPFGRSRQAGISLARGEHEAFQLVLHPEQTDSLRSAEARWRSREHSAGLRVECQEVAYVRVSRPTDATGSRGEYPDPLPPLSFPLRLEAGLNQPLWISVYAASNAPAGRHAGELILETGRDTVRVPFEVRVYDFELPREAHLRTAFGLDPSMIERYHGLKDPVFRQAVYDQYLANFAAHRISPYSFFTYSPIEVRFVGQGEARKANLDFTRFDAAATRWLDGAGFNSYRLPVQGMGGGTFHSRHLGELDGHREGTEEHARLFRDYLSQVERHLRGKGWLDEAYVYWFDEPDPKDYAFVVEGMRRLKAAAPGLKRLLTEQPEAELRGHVEIWCGLTPEWTREKVRERRQAGEQVWWYICTAPQAPYITEFIDHPGLELRLWPWQSWQYGVDGLLVWETVYWTSPLVYPEPQVQDPWKDPMSYVTGYGFGPGHVGYWGNGDGRFLYPPRGILS